MSERVQTCCVRTRSLGPVRLWLSDKHLFVDPHERARVIGFTFILNAVKAVAPLAVVPLVVVVKLHLPHGFKRPYLCELQQKHKDIWVSWWLCISTNYNGVNYFFCTSIWRMDEEKAFYQDRWLNAHCTIPQTAGCECTDGLHWHWCSHC